MPLRQQDLDNAIFVPKRVEQTLPGDGIICYTLQTYMEDTDGKDFVRNQKDDKTFAYMETKKGITKYMALMNWSGDFFDATVSATSLDRFIEKQRGGSEWSFKSVNKNAFMFYLNFLRTRNSTWLSHAKREQM